MREPSLPLLAGLPDHLAERSRVVHDRPLRSAGEFVFYRNPSIQQPWPPSTARTERLFAKPPVPTRIKR